MLQATNTPKVIHLRNLYFIHNLARHDMRNLLIIGFLIALTGCSTAVKFDSVPPGASVTCNGCRGWGDTDSVTPLGVTPFEAVVSDRFGWHSEYVFTAKKEGFKPGVVTVNEKTIPDGTSFEFFPKTINFQLQK
jgi:hypothetical protein